MYNVNKISQFSPNDVITPNYISISIHISAHTPLSKIPTPTYGGFLSHRGAPNMDGLSWKIRFYFQKKR